ncbi:hypothetical protein DFH11DRAFT_1544686 [Phellopilus nigrolimitatus]|nr:hypothetical protein DFH11DRAFT_1544686 [Phellopilus nigrolimitatus]
MAAADAYSGDPLYLTVVDNLVTITDSDGSFDRLPRSKERVVLEDGTVNYLAAADPDTDARWRDKIATFLIMEGAWHDLPRQRHYILTAFPRGYRLYTHRKGDKSNPRQDSYLYGSTTCKVFRSPEEFVLHAKWLAYGQPRDHSNRTLCGCHYCSGTLRSEISEMLKAAVSHLNSERPPTEGGRPGMRSRKVPVLAKDYTNLDASGSTSRRVKSTVFTHVEK